MYFQLYNTTAKNNRKIEFVGINIWDHQQAALGHLEEFETTYPNGIDIEGRIGIEYGVRGIPEKYFVDQNGTLSRKYIGPIQLQVLREIISDLVVN